MTITAAPRSISNPTRSVAPSIPAPPKKALPHLTATAHVVVKGDNLTKIAKAHGCTVAELLAANPQIKNPDHIEIGDQIALPAKRQPARPDILDPTKPRSVSPGVPRAPLMPPGSGAFSYGD